MTGRRRRRRRRGKKRAATAAARAALIKLGPGPSLLQTNIDPSDRQRVAQLIVQALKGGSSVPVEVRPNKHLVAVRSEKQRAEPF